MDILENKLKVVNDTTLTDSGVDILLSISKEKLENDGSIQVIRGKKIFIIEKINGTIFLHERNVNLFEIKSFELVSA